MGSLSELKKELKKQTDPKQAIILQRFFKTGPGEYGEGDVFLGIKVPIQRKIAKKYIALDLIAVQDLLYSKIHEHRMCAVLILIDKYQRADEKAKKEIVNFFLKHSKQINNWDLVDVSTPKILGDYLLNKPRQILYQYAGSNNLWQRRIAIIATFAFIRVNDFADTMKISKIILNDEHDLIHKAVGWMLREVGKRDKKTEVEFLEKYSTRMPRVMLRYAIEKFSEKQRKYYLKMPQGRPKEMP